MRRVFCPQSWLGVVMLALLMLAGCSDPQPEAATEVSPSPRPSYSLPAEPPEPKRYRSLDEIAAEFERAGVDLTVEALGVGNNGDTLRDFAIMSTQDVRLNVYLFDNAQFRDMWLPQIQAEFEVVSGPNWIIVTLGSTDLVHGVLGGTISGP